MKSFTIFIVILLILFTIPSCFAEIPSGLAIKYIEGCEIDLNNDGELDIAILFESSKGCELVVLIRTKEGYNSYLLNKGGANLRLSCHYGKTIKETSVGKGEGKSKIYKTNGKYIVLSQAESSAVAFFWVNGKFKKVWISD